MSDLTSERLAQLDQARSEARDDLDRLLTHFDAERAAAGEPAAVAEVVQGLIDEPMWDRMLMASVLGEALARLVDQPTATREATTR